METESTTKRLAALLVDALEIGSGKSERDVADDLFRGFGLDLPRIEASVPRLQRKAKLREAAACALADAAATPEMLMAAAVRCGGRFIAMLDEIYALLSEHAATTTGAAQTFRLRRDGDGPELEISDAFIERVRHLRAAIVKRTTGRIDHDALQRFVVWDNGFYGQWPLAGGIRLLDSLLRADAIGSARPEAEELVAELQRIVELHLANLSVLASRDSDEIPGDRASAELDAEVRVFRATGALGATAQEYWVDGVESSAFIGLKADGTPVQLRHLPYGYSTMGAIAQFLAMWRLGLSTRRGDTAPQHEIARSCREATMWLREDAVASKHTTEVESLVEDFEEFLNLPLWRGRALLYEIWVLCETLRACEATGWSADIRLTGERQDTWILEARPTDAPIARLTHAESADLALEIWREPRRAAAPNPLTPDVTIATPGEQPRDLVVIEAKDRHSMQVRGGPRSALAVARRYQGGLHPSVTWVCNHCDSRADDASAAINFGDAWSAIHLASSFRPGSVPATFAESLAVALTPPSERAPRRTKRLVVVLDVTASMEWPWQNARTHLLDANVEHLDKFNAILYADHGSCEPFVTRALGPYLSIDELVHAIDVESRGEGGDAPEALEDAMAACRRLADIEGPLTALVLTDAPPHDATRCPEGFDFAAEVQALLDGGSRCLVCDEWQTTPAIWQRFRGHPEFREASLADLICELTALR